MDVVKSGTFNVNCESLVIDDLVTMTEMIGGEVYELDGMTIEHGKRRGECCIEMCDW